MAIPLKHKPDVCYLVENEAGKKVVCLNQKQAELYADLMEGQYEEVPIDRSNPGPMFQPRDVATPGVGMGDQL